MTIRLTDIGAQALRAPLDESSPDRRFRRTVRLSLPTGGQADLARIAGNAVMTLRFRSRLANALDGDAVERATLSASSGDLKLTLPTARRINRITLDNAASSDRVALFRIDGQSVATEPVAANRHLSGGATFNVTDQTLIVRRRVGSTYHPIPTDDVANVELAYSPANPAVAFQIIGDPDGQKTLPPVLDADGQPIFPSNANRGADFAAALSGQIARLPKPLPDPLLIDVFLEADEPCDAEVTALSLTLDLEAQALAEKSVLRFPGKRIQQRRILLNVPPGSRILSAPLILSRSPAPRQKAQPATAGSASAPVGSDGIAVAAEASLASRLTLPGAVLASGVQVWISAPDEMAECLLRLREDTGNVPGTILVESAAQLFSGPVPAPRRFTFVPFAMPSGPAWIEIVVQRGRLIIMLVSDSDGQLATGRAGGFRIHRVAGRRAAADLLSDPRPDSVDPNTALQVSLAGQPVTLAAAERLLTADLATALNAAGTGGSVPLVLSSALPALITLDPPRLRYRLAAAS